MRLVNRSKVLPVICKPLALNRVSALRVLIAVCIASIPIFSIAETNAVDIAMMDKPRAWPRGDELVIARSNTPGICLLAIGQLSYPVPFPVVLTGTRANVTAMVSEGMLDVRSCAVHGLQNLMAKAPRTSPKSPAMRWNKGSNDELAWMQFVAHDTDQPAVSFFRWAADQKVEIRIHGLDPDAAITQEFPRFAAFTLRTGQGKGAITLDGIGQVGRDDEGNQVFSSKSAADSKNFKRVRGLIGRVDKFMTLSMESITLKLPVDKETKNALQSLLSK